MGQITNVFSHLDKITNGYAALVAVIALSFIAIIASKDRKIQIPILLIGAFIGLAIIASRTYTDNEVADSKYLNLKEICEKEKELLLKEKDDCITEKEKLTTVLSQANGEKEKIREQFIELNKDKKQLERDNKKLLAQIKGNEGTYTHGYYEGLAVFRKDDKCGYKDQYGNIVIKPKFRSASRFSCGLAGIKGDNGKWGFIEKSGAIAIECRFEKAERFERNEAIVYTKTEKIVIGRDGEWKRTIKYLNNIASR